MAQAPYETVVSGEATSALSPKPKGGWLQQLTTDSALRASELREIAHNRWSIENNQFKETNVRVGSKRAYLKNKTAKEACLRMVLLKEFKAHLEELPDLVNWTVKKTKKLIAQVILFGFPCEAPPNHSPPFLPKGNRESS